MFFLFILVIFLILTLVIYTGGIGVEVQNLVLDSEKSPNEIINEDSKIYLYIILFGQIKLLKRNVKDIKLKKIKIPKNKNFKINYIELLKNIDINYFDLHIQIGTTNASFTAVLIGFISSLLGIILKSPKYEVIPVYLDKNIIKIKFNCIISIHLMQYINKSVIRKIKNSKRGYFKKKVEV